MTSVIIRLFNYKKHHILTPELHHPVKPLKEKLHICETYQKDLKKKKKKFHAKQSAIK